MRRVVLAMAVFCIVTAGFTTQTRADDLFVLITNIEGESRDVNHPGWMDVTSIQWGAEGPPPDVKARPQLGPLVITKFSDSTSVGLALSAANGHIFPELKLEATKPFGDARKVTYRIRLTDVRVVSYKRSEAANNIPTETVEFAYSTITWIAFKLSSTGQLLGNTSACWDVINNKLCAVRF